MMTVQSLDATFSALADPTRRAILSRLAHKNLSVTEIAEPYAVSLPAISKHLRVLENAGLIHRRKEGRVHYCELTTGPMKDAARWIEECRRFWQMQFDALDGYLKRINQEEESWKNSASPEPSRRRRKKSTGRGPTRKS